MSSSRCKRGLLDLAEPFPGGSSWFVESGSPPAATPFGGYVEVAASAVVFCPLRVGQTFVTTGGAFPAYPAARIVAVTVFARSISSTTDLQLRKTNGTGSVDGTGSILTLSGGGNTITVPADGNLSARVLTLQTPEILSAGRNLLLKVTTAVGSTFRGSLYVVTTDVGF